MNQQKNIVRQKPALKRIGESYTRDRYVLFNVSVSERIAVLNERCKSNDVNSTNQNKKQSKLSKLPKPPPFVGASYVGTRNIMDGKHPYLLALKEENKKKDSGCQDKEVSSPKTDVFDRLSKPMVRTNRSEREAKISTATSNRSDQSKYSNGNSNRGESSPSAHNRFGYKKQSPSLRVATTKIVPNGTSTDKNLASTRSLQQKSDTSSYNKTSPPVKRTSSRERHKDASFGKEKKHISEKKTGIPAPNHESVKLKGSTSEAVKERSKSSIPQSKPRKLSHKIKPNSDDTDTELNKPSTPQRKRRLASPKRLPQSKGNGSANINPNKSCETDEQKVSGESVCDYNSPNEYHAGDSLRPEVDYHCLDREEKEMICHRSNVSISPTKFEENKNFFINLAQRYEIEKANNNKGNALCYKHSQKDFISANQTKPTDVEEPRSAELAAVKDSKRRSSNSDSNMGKEEVIPNQIHRMLIDGEDKDICEESRVINFKQIPDDKGVNKQIESKNKSQDQPVNTDTEERTNNYIPSNNNTHTLEKLKNNPNIVLKTSKEKQLVYSDENSLGSPDESNEPFQNLRKKVNSYFSKDSDSEDSLKKQDFKLESIDNVPGHFFQKPCANQDKEFDGCSESSEENSKPFKFFRKKIHPVFTQDSDSEDNSNKIVATPDSQAGMVPSQRDRKNLNETQQYTRKAVPETPKENPRPIKKALKDQQETLSECSSDTPNETIKLPMNVHNKLSPVSSHYSDSEDILNKLTGTHSLSNDNASDKNDKETPTLRYELLENPNSILQDVPNEKRKPFKTLQNKPHIVFDSDGSSNETDSTLGTISTISSYNEESSEKNVRSSDESGLSDARLSCYPFIDPEKSNAIHTASVTQIQVDSLPATDSYILKSNDKEEYKSNIKGTPESTSTVSAFKINSEKTPATSENVEAKSVAALVEATAPVGLYVSEAAEIQRCPTVNVKTLIKDQSQNTGDRLSSGQNLKKDLIPENNVETSTYIKSNNAKNIAENEGLQIKSCSQDSNSKPEFSNGKQEKHNKFTDDSIVDLLQKLNADQNESKDQQVNKSQNENSSPNPSEVKPVASPPRPTPFTRFRSKMSSIFSLKSNKQKIPIKGKSAENEGTRDSKDENEVEGDEKTVLKLDIAEDGINIGHRDSNDSSRVLCKDNINEEGDKPIRTDVQKPVKDISNDANDKMKNSDVNCEEDAELNQEESKFNNKVSREHDHKTASNLFHNYFYPNKENSLGKSKDIDPSLNYTDDKLIEEKEEGYSSEGRKVSRLNSISSSTSTVFKTPPSEIPSTSISEDDARHSNSNVYYGSDDTESLLESSSFYTGSILSESEFPSEKEALERATSPSLQQLDGKGNESPTTAPWYNKFKKLFGLKKNEKTPEDGSFSWSESYHPEMLNPEVDPDTISNSSNNIIYDDVISEDIDREIATPKAEMRHQHVNKNSEIDSEDETNSNVTDIKGRLLSQTVNHKSTNNIPNNDQLLNRYASPQERHLLKRLPPLDENTNFTKNSNSIEEYSLSSDSSHSDNNFSQDSLENEETTRRPTPRKADISQDTKIIPKSKTPTKVPVRVKKTNFKGHKKPVLSLAQSQLMEDPNKEFENESPQSKYYDNFHRISTIPVDESHTLIQNQTRDSGFNALVNLEEKNTLLIRRVDGPKTKNLDRYDVMTLEETKNQMADDQHDLPEKGNRVNVPACADSLDENLLVRIFSFLDQRNLTTVPLVCKKWKRASCHPSLWQFVVFSNGRMSGNFLEHISHRFTNLKELSFENIQGRPKHRGESEKFYQEEIKGGLEKSLEAVLINAEGSLKKLSLINCGPIFTERTLWLVSCYARVLEEFTYHSALTPPTAMVLWALVCGCRDIKKLDLSPVNPRSPQQERFNNKCINLIVKGYPNLRSISLGGCGIDSQGLIKIAEQCQNLEELVLNQYLADFDESFAKKLCKLGLKNLTCLKFIHTPVQCEIIQTFIQYCTKLKKIKVQVGIQDYFSNTEDTKLKQQYRFIIVKINSLKAFRNLEEVIELDIQQDTK